MNTIPHPSSKPAVTANVYSAFFDKLRRYSDKGMRALVIENEGPPSETVYCATDTISRAKHIAALLNASAK